MKTKFSFSIPGALVAHSFPQKTDERTIDDIKDFIFSEYSLPSFKKDLLSTKYLIKQDKILRNQEFFCLS